MGTVRIRLLATLALAALVATACTSTTPSASAGPSAGPSFAEASTTEGTGHSEEPGHGDEPMIAFTAASATITVDGDTSDWSDIEGATVNLEQIRLENLPPAVAAEMDFDPVEPVDVTFKVASDDENLYVLVEVPGGFVYNPDDHNLSASIAVMFRIDSPAAPHMGAEEPDLDDSLGMVDIWHWELDCAAGEASGGGTGTGDDPECNLDDEYSTTPERREDDGGGDVANADAENTLAGVWEHTARASGPGADGTWIFEMSRPLQSGDPQDAQFVSGGTAHVALAFFDPTEGAAGWTDAGHLQSAYNGWIEVTLE
jgi:hypothetical protein